MIKDVHPHAISRFRERTGCKQLDEYIRDKLLEIASKSSPATFTHKRHEVLALINHNFQPATYLLSESGFVLVVVDGCIKTMHKNETKKWEKIDP